MKERLLEVLKRERYGVKDLANWLGISYQGVWKKLNGKGNFTYGEMIKMKEHLGKKNIIYIFF